MGKVKASWKKPWSGLPRRVCRYLNHCAVCGETIESGEEYYDGGSKRRAHVRCVQRVEGE